MPAPAVYVLAILGTVGAALVFKEFVYEPHIAPAIDRWKVEYQAARRRRQAQAAAMHRSETDLLMSERDGSSSSRREAHNDDNDDYISDDDKPLATSSKLLKDGLLLRRQASYQDSVELDDLVAREVSEWRNEATGQVLRQRKNVSEHSAMDESNHSIPFSPLSPSKTHVVIDSSPSTSASGSRVPSLPQSPLHPKSQLSNVILPVGLPQTERSASQDPVPDVKSLPSPPVTPQVPPAPATPPMSQTLWSPPPQSATSNHMITQSTLVGNLNSSTTISISSSSSTGTNNLAPPQPPPFHRTPTFASSPIRSPEPELFLYDPAASTLNVDTTASADDLDRGHVHPLVNIPSLSQSYPQELDYEHGLELLSPPSSRSISPFSMGGMSPNPFANNNQSLRASSASPFDNIPSRSVSSMSNLSSVMSSPAVIPVNVRSPLMMELGNESYDTLSPVALQARQIDQPHRAGLAPASSSPFLDPSPAQRQQETLSATNSARSTAYLSFDEDEDDERGSTSGGSDAQPYANLGGSIGDEGTYGPASVYQSIHQSQSHSSIRASTTTVNAPGSAAAHMQRTSSSISSSSSSAFSSGALSPEGHSLGLSFFPVQPHLPPLPSQSQASARTQQPAYTDADLSDLDFMSDYTHSEVASSDVGDFSDVGEDQRGPSRSPSQLGGGGGGGVSVPSGSDGNDSDSSWSMAGSPRMGRRTSDNAASTSSASGSKEFRGDLERGGTIKAAKGARGASGSGYGYGRR
ncbi:hypothetical protein D9613_004738 [Agrocybe pediades]|uniref:Uncharacterized protein n=1 Tax=Agrocybe pediades TaxID=84607 RepID=A0A8H4QZP7_9AGAR|nr:hypothetical protein D9613_004738 [Agrocybe pediades]